MCSENPGLEVALEVLFFLPELQKRRHRQRVKMNYLSVSLHNFQGFYFTVFMFNIVEKKTGHVLKAIPVIKINLNL